MDQIRIMRTAFVAAGLVTTALLTACNGGGGGGRQLSVTMLLLPRSARW